MILRKYGVKEEFETTTNDFKRFLNGGDKSFDWLKTIAAFANTKGGTLYDGIDDEGYNPIGFDKKTVDSQVRLFLRLVKEHIRPEPKVDIRYLPIQDEKFIIEFFVNLSSSRPTIFSYDGTGSIFVRDEGKTRLATTEEIQRMALECVYVDYDSTFSNIKFEKENFTKMFAQYKSSTGKELSEKELYSIGFFDSNKILRHASLLFSDSYHGEETLLSITDFLGLTKGGDRLVSEPLFNGNIIDGIAMVQEYLKRNSKPVYHKTAKGAKDTSSYPARAVTEGIVNAYAHKNYLIPHSQIEVNVFLDRVEIISPGSVVGRYGFGKKKDLSSLIPIRRNPFICEVLSLLHLMERKGSGFDKIENDYSDFPERFLPFASSDEVSFSLTLPNLSYPYGIADSDNNDIDIEYIHPPKERGDDRKVLSYCYFKNRSLSEIASMLGKTPSTYLRNTVLGDLVKAELLQVSKIGNKDYYKTNKAFVRIRGDGN